jgi:hypothetical protein
VANPAPPGLKKETCKVDVLLPEYQYLHPGLKFTALIKLKQLSQALAVPADAMTYLLEILKFLGILTLIGASALIMLMVG